jgi:hypothetical protein
MGVSYLSFLLNEEIANWLLENNVAIPSMLPDIRFPTLRELMSVAEQLDGYTVTMALSNAANTVDIEVVDRRGYHAGWSTTVWASKLDDKSRPPEDGDTVQFNFHKGSPELAVVIAEKLTRFCGPLVLVQDLDASPLLVTMGIDPQRAVEKWLNE